MKIQTPEHVLIFIHINKAAGSTLEEIIANNYEKREMFETVPTDLKNSILMFKNLPESILNNYTCLQGHMGFGLHSCFKNRRAIYITMLREPLSRIVSLYNHTKRSPKMPIWKKGFHPEMSIEEFVENRIYFHTNNGQTRYLASTDGLPIDLNDKPDLDREDLERAKKHLEKHISVVGVQEYFDEYLLLLREVLNLKDIYYVKRNVTRKASNILRLNNLPKRVVKILEDNNSFDLELYDYAKSLFKQELEMFPSINEKSLKSFRETNQKKMCVKTFVIGLRAQAKRILKFIKLKE